MIYDSWHTVDASEILRWRVEVGSSDEIIYDGLSSIHPIQVVGLGISGCHQQFYKGHEMWHQTQTRHYYKENPSKLPYVCIVSSPKNQKTKSSLMMVQKSGEKTTWDVFSTL